MIFEHATRNCHPQVAIISLDYFLFTDAWDQAYSGTRAMIYDQPFHYLKASLVSFLRAASLHPLVFRDYLRSPTQFIGHQSIVDHEGFRNDGSYPESIFKRRASINKPLISCSEQCQVRSECRSGRSCRSCALPN